MKTMLLFLGVMVLILTISCDEPPSHLIVENKIGYDIYCVFSNSFPDTGITFLSEGLFKHNLEGVVRAFETKNVGGVAYCDYSVWQQYILKDTLILFVFNKDYVDMIPWDSVIQNYEVVRRMYFNYEQISNNDCKITVK